MKWWYILFSLILLGCSVVASKEEREQVLYLRENIYKPRYKKLTPSIYLMNETVLNPQLRDDANWRRKAAEMNISTYIRYYLTSLEKNRRYVVSVSFMGSPSAHYTFALIQMPRSMVGQRLAADGAFSVQDATHLVFKTSLSSGDLFHPEQKVLYYRTGEANRLHEVEVNTNEMNDDYVAVLEIFPMISSSPDAVGSKHPEQIPFYYYTVQLEPFFLNLFPAKYVPLVVAIIVALLASIPAYNWVMNELRGC